MNKCRTFNTSILLKRFYVIKSKTDPSRNGARFTGEIREGEKLRPIGCPDIPSRVISRSFTDLTYAVCWNSFYGDQHGFRMHRGVHTCLFDMLCYIKANPDFKIFEFDFKAFFNNVSPQ